MKRIPHAIIGAATGLVVAHVAQVDPMLPAGIAALGAVLPDIDQRWAPRNLPLRIGAPARVLEHRGPTHSLLAVVLLAVGFPVLGIPLATGYLSHLLADGLSYMGVPYLWPLSASRYRLLPYGYRMRSGSLIEYPIALVLLGMAAIAQA